MGTHASKIRPQDPRRLTGSVDLDRALARTHPNAPRWDYGIGYDLGHREAAYWIEVHPANTSNVREVIQKLIWLKGFLQQNAPLWHLTQNAGNPYRWIASGKVNISRNTPQFRQLSQSGLGMPTSNLAIP
ncbi:MAG: hypothetical protein D6819_10380 [Gammaproteobacteria bacterium]|nr:MAG: hypothetical protein D6819_10380 [Gammaproteobacteria bacterium]